MINGEGRSSYGYESSGVKVNNRNREEFGEGYTVGDTVACYIVSGLTHYFFFFYKWSSFHCRILTVIPKLYPFPRMVKISRRLSQ